jgi:hypothetical protein
MTGIETQETPSLVLTNKAQLVTHTVGKSATWADWRQHLQSLGQLQRTVFADEDMAQIRTDGLLLSFQFQETSIELEPHFQQWGLHSATLAAQPNEEVLAWTYDWPLGLHSQELNRAGVIQALGQTLVTTKKFSIFECEVGGQNAPRTIGVQCDWTQNQQLASLTLLRLGEFEPLSAFEFAPQADSPSGGDHVALDQPSVAYSVISCRSGEPTPKTGIYEGLLPASHPLAASYNKSNMRFYFSQEGKPMIRMGMPDKEQESLVVWIWRAASVQDMR